MESASGGIADLAARIAADRLSGASELIGRAITLLERAVEAGGDGVSASVRREALGAAARMVAGAQPAMGAFWNAAAIAIVAPPSGGRAGLDRLRQQIDRAPRALARIAAATLTGPVRPMDPIHVVTCSFSGSVLACCAAIAESGPLVVSCGEGRPAMEGRRFAEAIAARGIPVRLSTDAGLALALDRAHALVVGADAVTPGEWINKAGSGPLAAAAAARGIPVYVVASREKFVPEALAPCLRIDGHSAEEVWESAPAGVTVVNRIFERVPLSWVTAFLTDAGACGSDHVAEVCRANGRVLTAETIGILSRTVAGSR